MDQEFKNLIDTKIVDEIDKVDIYPVHEVDNPKTTDATCILVLAEECANPNLTKQASSLSRLLEVSNKLLYFFTTIPIA